MCGLTRSPVARSASPPGGGGSISASASAAAMSGVATPRPTGTHRRISGKAPIPSSSRSSRVSDGAGVTWIRFTWTIEPDAGGTPVARAEGHAERESRQTAAWCRLEPFPPDARSSGRVISRCGESSVVQATPCDRWHDDQPPRRVIFAAQALLHDWPGLCNSCQPEVGWLPLAATLAGVKPCSPPS